MKKIFSSLVIFSIVISTVGVFPVSALASKDRDHEGEEEVHKVNICHKNGESGNWKAISVDSEGWNGHSGHADDYLYAGPTGDEEDEDEGLSDDWCKDHAPVVDVCPNIDKDQATIPDGYEKNEDGECVLIAPTPTTATISATKIVCDSETDLPNWGAGAADIKASTASDFLAAHPNTCHLEKDWKFQWAPIVASNPGDNTGAATSPWTEFDSATGVNGIATVVVPAGATVWVREEMKDGFVPFSGATSNLDATDSKNSAEMYCSTDVFNYDNLDYVDSPVAGQTYHCVAFNAKKVTSQCPIPDLNATGWYTDYFNYKSTDPDMQDGSGPWETPHGDPLGVASPWVAHWYDSTFYKFSRVDGNLMFGSNFFPFDSTVYADAGDVASYGHEFHFGTHSSSKITVPTTGSYAYELTSDDDAWVYIDGALVVNNPGIHAANLVTGSVNLTAGTHIVNLYFAERQTVGSELTFKFVDESVVVHPYSPLCETVVPPTDVCSNMEGNQASVPAGYHAEGTQCLPDAPAPKACADGRDNDEDNLVDTLDPGCHTDGNASNIESYDPNDNDETNAPSQPTDVCPNIEGNQSSVPEGKHLNDGQCVDNTTNSNPNPSTPPSNGGGNGPVVGSFGGGNGMVLGASTTKGEVLGASCGMYMEKHIRLGSSKNDKEQVKKLQVFLNKWMGTNIPVTGVYGQATFNAVKAFQAKYSDDILKPWGENSPTGLVYLATLRKINKLECPDLSLELPTLVPWSRNPNAQ